MINESRPVDLAMQENRPEKQKMRSLWLEKVKKVAENYPDSELPWYTTLPGSEGRDIELLIDEGLLELTEVNSIAENSQNRVVAIEHNDEAVLNLQKKFVGLSIKDFNFQNLIKGDGIFAWPDGEDRKVCRSRIINLDLNSILKCNQNDEQIVFPILEWIKKLCHIHTHPTNIDWTLCLTLNGEINWSQEVINFTENFLKDNFKREPKFQNSCRSFLGEDFFNTIINNSELNLNNLNWSYQQKYLMIFVPKYISNIVHTEGWKIRTEYNLRYGGEDGTAPMVSWIIKFEIDPKDASEPDRIYRESLINILYRIGIINQNGEIES